MDNIKNTDFKKALFDVSNVTENTDVLAEFPRLAQHREFCVPLPSYLSKGLLLRYIVLMYDSQLAIRELIPDTNRRKIECAEAAGFKMGSNDKFPDEIENVLMCMNPYVNAMIIAYCRLQRMPKYTSLISIEEAHSKLLKKLMDEGTDKSSVLKAINDMEDEMEERMLELLNYDKSFYLYQSLYESVESERLALRPEDIAIGLKKGQDPIGVHPYGKGYKLDHYTQKDVESGRKSAVER